DPPAELPAVHLRHHDVGDDQVRLLDESLVEGFLAVERGDGLVALVLQEGADDVDDVLVVVDDQHLLHATGRLPQRRRMGQQYRPFMEAGARRTLQEIAATIGGTVLAGSPALEITNLAALEAARAGDLSF